MKHYLIILRLCFFCALLGILFWLLSSIQYTYKNNGFVSVKYVGDSNYPIICKNEINKMTDQFLNNNDSLDKDINTKLLEDLVLKKKYVKKAEVYLDLEGTVNVYVDLRQPFVRWLINDSIYYLDSEGVLLPRLLNIDKNLLVLTGDLSEQNSAYLFELIRKIYNNAFLNNLIGGVHFDSDIGCVLSVKKYDLDIKLGEDTVLDDVKIKMIQEFFNFLSSDLSCDYCKEINIQYDKQIICIK